MIRVSKKQDNPHTFFQTHFKSLCLILAAIIINIIIFYLYFNKYQSPATMGKKVIITIFLLIALQVSAFAILFRAKRKKWKIEKIFLILSIPIGLLYMVLIPIGRVPDEGAHFARIYEISTGHFTSDVDENGIPGSIEDSNVESIVKMSESTVYYWELPEYASITANSDTQKFIQTSSYNYNIINYFPQVIGMSIGNILHLPLLISSYLARFFNLIICLVIVYFSIKYTPFLKKGFMFIAFLPITMQAFASLSADGLPIAISMALISFLLYSTYSMKNRFTKKQILLIATICITLCLCKTIYAPLCLLLFTIPKTRFKNSKQKLTTIISIGIICIALVLGWLSITPPLVSISDSATQTTSILTNPLRFFGIILNSILTNSGLYIAGLFGGFLEWFNVDLSFLYVIYAYTIFVLICLEARKKWHISNNVKIISATVCVIVILAAFTVMYTQWTQVGETVIDGVQGRYFLPILSLPIILCLPSSKNKPTTTEKISPEKHNYYLYGCIVFISFYALAHVIATHI